MELTKIQFEDGQKVSDAYVEINGVKHPVVKAQYQGKTPLSARNLNKMQENMETAISDLDERVVSYRNVLVDEQALIKECGGLKLKKLNKLEGKTEQEVREGYNLVNNTLYKKMEHNGLTFTPKEDGGVLISGTATNTTCDGLLIGGWNYTTKLVEFDTSSQYTLSLKDNTNTKIKAMLVNGTNVIASTSSKNTFTPKYDSTTLIMLRYTGEVGDVVNTTVYPMLVKGSEDKPYEAYGASPTPDFPSEVKTVTGNVEVDIFKDLMESATVYEKGYINSSNEIISANNWSYTDYIDISDKNYKYNYISFGTGNNPKTILYNADKSVKEVLGVTPQTIDLSTKNASYVRISYANDTTAPKLKKYKKFPLTLGDLKIFEDGNLYGTNSKWYIRNKYLETKLRSDMVWKKSPNGYWYYVDLTDLGYAKGSPSTIWSTHFKQGRWTAVNTTDKDIICLGNTVYGIVGISVASFDSIDTLKTFLDNNEVYIVGQLATPTDTEITDTTLIAQLNALENATLYEGITIISITGDNLTPIADLDYWTWFKGETGEFDSIYSTEEKRIGTWIDGKPLYRKVITTNMGVSKEFISSQPGMAMLEKGFVYIDSENNKYYFPLNFSRPDREVYVSITNNTIKVITNFQDWELAKVTLILNYTKTTD